MIQFHLNFLHRGRVKVRTFRNDPVNELIFSSSKLHSRQKWSRFWTNDDGFTCVITPLFSFYICYFPNFASIEINNLINSPFLTSLFKLYKNYFGLRQKMFHANQSKLVQNTWQMTVICLYLDLWWESLKTEAAQKLFGQKSWELFHSENIFDGLQKPNSTLS